jgi:anti-sigma-K factor RskA
MTDDHDLYADWAAAYTLGALDADDRHIFEMHLGSCSICRTEVADFAALPGLIAKVDPADLDHEPDANMAAAIEAAAVHQIATMRRRTTRWRTTALAASAAAAVIALVLFTTGGESGDGTTPGWIAAEVTSAQTETAEIGTTVKDFGTEITVELTGLPSRDSYVLWTVDNDGAWANVAAWAANPSGTADLVGATSTAAEDLDRIVVTSADIDDILVDATT